MDLSTLIAQPDAHKKKERKGRGPGSGLGKTAGKGIKGQKSRSGGKTIPGFEGGQIPLHKRLPKFGFTNINDQNYSLINVGSLNKIESTEVLTKEDLKKLGLIKKMKLPVKILGNGTVKKAIKIEADKASKSALEKIKKAGGEVILPKVVSVEKK